MRFNLPDESIAHKLTNAATPSRTDYPSFALAASRREHYNSSFPIAITLLSNPPFLRAQE